jgi:hypothetical protein
MADTTMVRGGSPASSPAMGPGGAAPSSPTTWRWVLLHYRLPPTPSAVRVHLWRKLKSLGAVLLHDAVWVLPDTPWTAEQMEWLAAEVVESGGEALVWRGTPMSPAEETRLVDRFLAQSTKEYEALWQELAAASSAFGPMVRRYQQVRRRDYFGAPVGQRVYQALRERGGHH